MRCHESITRNDGDTVKRRRLFLSIPNFGTEDIFRGIMVSLYVKGKENGHVQAHAPPGAIVLK